MNIQVKILEVSGLELAFAYVGLPVGKATDPARMKYFPASVWADQEQVLAKLISQGDEHAKIMRQVVVHMEIIAPRYWWIQFSTYESGREMYSESTMHTLLRDKIEQDRFTPETAFSAALSGALGTRDLVQAKANLPEGYLQPRLVMVSYQALRRMWLQRRGHRLPEWTEFIEALHELPYCHNLIFVEPHNPWRELWVEYFDSDGQPWLYDDEDEQDAFCTFCGNNEKYGHSRTCVYARVKSLLDEEAK